MSFPSPSSWFIKTAKTPSKGRQRLAMELLEDRVVPATFVVTSPVDSLAAGTLRWAVNEANTNPGGDAINFAPSVGSTITLDGGLGQILITDDLTINGPGAGALTIDGDNATRVFGIVPDALALTPNVTPSLAQLADSPSVSITGLTISNGFATDALGFDPTDPATAVFAFGGGIFNMGGTLSLSRVHMTGNVASNVITAGGAIANEFGGTLTISNSHFEGNQSAGVLIGVGGAITSDLGPTTDGVTTGQPDVTVSRSSFVNNTAQSLFGDDGTPFTGLAGGGAILNVTGALTVSRSEFSGNLAQGGVGANPPFLPPAVAAGFASGGAILNVSTSPFGSGAATLEVTGSTFTGNMALGGDGIAANIPGGIAKGGAISVGDVSSVPFPVTGTGYSPGVPLVTGETAPYEFSGFSSLLGNYTGTGVFEMGEFLDPATGTFQVDFEFVAENGDILTVDSKLNPNPDALNTFTLTPPDVNGNVTARFEAEFFVDTSRSTGSFAEAIGGSIVLVAESSPFSPITDPVTGLTGEFTMVWGGEGIVGFASDASSANLSGNLFDGNTAIGGSGGTDASGGLALGGGVAGTSGAMLELSRNLFRNNSATGGIGGGSFLDGNGLGGGLGLMPFVQGDLISAPTTATVSRDQFENNVAGGLGGGIYNDGELEVNRATFEGNEAVGNANAVVVANPAAKIGGGAAGGGIANFGDLHVSGSQFDGNKATGADSVTTTGSFFLQETNFPGSVFGGGIANVGMGVADVINSNFYDNIAEAGDYGDGEFAGIASGGAVANTSALSISGGYFRGNQAIASDNATSPFHNGHALGGAINSGSLEPAFGGPGATLTVERSTLVDNHAIGGNNNTVLLPADQVPFADGPNNGYGGGILVYQGTAEIDRTNLYDNQAIGGVGGETVNGSLGVGGGAFFFSFLGPVDATVSGGIVSGNQAIGGGGVGIGGGIATGTLGAPFGAPGTVEISRTRIIGNQAWGGIGGGIFNDANLTLNRATVTDNQAIGQKDVFNTLTPGYAFQGAGLGGGLANLGTVDVNNSNFSSNQAIGSIGNVGPNFLTLPPGTALPTYPGIAIGGGIYNSESATVSNSRFFRNEAQGGNDNEGTYAGVGAGGGFYNDKMLHIESTLLFGNRALGGDDNTGDINAGLGFGGGIASGSVAALLGISTAELTIERSNLWNNEAIGGSGNQGIIPVPPAFFAGNATGGAINVYQGTADFYRVNISRNTARAGDNGVAFGGGIMFLDYIGGVTATMDRSIVSNNSAIGSDDGDALGGGVGLGGLGSLFGAPGFTTITDTLFINNQALGGMNGDGLGGGLYNEANLQLSGLSIQRNQAVGGNGTNGGNGQGGGVYNASIGSVNMTGSSVVRNRAIGGTGVLTNGLGQGGGLFNSAGGLFDIDAITMAMIFANFASDDGDDIYGIVNVV